MADGTLDPSIILGVKQPTIENPMDAMTKAMTFKYLAMKNQNMGIQNQQAQQDFSDNQAMRSAQMHNITVNKDGSTSINNDGITSELAKTAPSLVPGQLAKNQALQLANLKNYHDTLSTKLDTASSLLAGVNPTQSTDPNDLPGIQQRYANALSGIKQMKGDTSQLPDQYDQNALLHGQASILAQRQASMSAKDQIESQQNEKRLEIQQQDLEMKRLQYTDTQQQSNFKDLMAHAESSRQLPDVKQAYTDRYNSQKVLDLVAPNGKADVNMVPMIASEIGKIASGGVPQHEELQAITPQDAKMIQARVQQYITSNPQTSGQDAFMKVFRNYSTTIQNGAQKVINKNVGQLENMYANKVKPSDINNFRNTFVNPENPMKLGAPEQDTPSRSPGSGSQVMSFDQWKASKGSASKTTQNGNGS
jgi:hypothetical protein